MNAPRLLVLHLLLALLTVATFLPVLGHGFVAFDDPLYVTDNRAVQAGLSADGVAWALRARVASNWHPLTLLSHMLDCELFGLNPRGHHLTSLLLHAGSVLLLFEVLRRATEATWRSVLVAALFAVHPTRVESVAWIAERKDVLSGFLFLLTLAAYLAYARRPSIARFLPVLLTFGLGLAAKPMLVTVPFVLLLLDVWPLRRWEPEAGWRCPLLLVAEKVPLLVLSAVSSLLTVAAQRGALAETDAAPAGLRIANALVSVVRYFGDLLFPRRLAVFYPFPPEIPAWQVVAAALLLVLSTAGVGLAALCAWHHERRSELLALPVGWFWFLGMLVPVLGLVQVGAQARADRYLYLPAIGFFVALVWGVSELLCLRERGPATVRASALAAGLVLLVLAAAARAQTASWVDTVALFRHAAAVTEGNYLAHLNLAEALRERGDPAEALAEYEAAIAARPALPAAHAALGSALRAWGRPAEALPYLDRAIALAPRDARFRLTRAAALDDLGRLDEAIAELQAVLALEPDLAPARAGLAALQRRLRRREEKFLFPTPGQP